MTGSPPRPRVAIIDSGIDAASPLVRGRADVIAGPSAVAAADRDVLGHGTAVAATILQFCPPGVRPEIVSLRVFDDAPTCDFEAVVEAIARALEFRPAIVNLSLGTTSLRHRDALQRCLDDAAAIGARVVAPASYAGLPCDPGNLAGVEAVVADPNVLPLQPQLRPHQGRLLWFASPLAPRNNDGHRSLIARGESLAVAAVSGLLLCRPT